MDANIADKTLSELCGWQGLARESEWQTYAVQNCLRLIDVPLREFTIEDMRLMIGQNMGVEYLMPSVIEQLQENPLVEGIYHEGDVLGSIVRMKPEFWRANPEWHRQVVSIVRNMPEVPREITGNIEHFLTIPEETKE